MKEVKENEMGDVSTVLTEPEVFLRPEEITIDDRFDVRLWVGDEEVEAKRVEELAQSIDRDGQLDAAIVTLTGDGHWVLMAGHRRRRAIILANQERTKNGTALLKLRCRQDQSGGDLKRKAIASNLHREGYTPMELASLIKSIREEHDWTGFPGAKKVAGYLGIDLATVTQHERFLAAPKSMQDDLHQGVISAKGAFDLLNVKPEKRDEVRELAKKIQEIKDEAVTPQAKKAREKKVELGKPGETGKRIQSAAIVEAIRQTPGATTKAIPLSRKELVESIAQMDSAVYGGSDGAVRQWAAYFVDSFAAGKGTTTTMLKKFDAMVAKAHRGTKPKPEPKPKAAAKKTVKPVKPAKKAKKDGKAILPKKKPATKAKTAKKKPFVAVAVEAAS